MTKEEALERINSLKDDVRTQERMVDGDERYLGVPVTLEAYRGAIQWVGHTFDLLSPYEILRGVEGTIDFHYRGERKSCVVVIQNTGVRIWAAVVSGDTEDIKLLGPAPTIEIIKQYINE